MPPLKAGIKRGAKKVDAESYIPNPGDWEETNILHDFGDGWLICEDRTEYDRRLMAKLTLTCVAGLIPQCYPGVPLEEQLERKIQALIKTGYTEKQAKVEAAYWAKSRKATGEDRQHYKLAHVRDPEGRPMSCILMARKSEVDSPKPGLRLQYADSNDLGQSAGVEIDGDKWIICEVRLGTGKAGPRAAEERVIEWFTAATGGFNEEAYLHRQITRREYAAITNHPTDAALAEFRRAVQEVQSEIAA